MGLRFANGRCSCAVKAVETAMDHKVAATKTANGEPVGIENYFFA